MPHCTKNRDVLELFRCRCRTQEQPSPTHVSPADERRRERNIAFYVEDPHVMLASAPQELFLDPSHTYRLWFAHYRAKKESARGFFIRRLRRKPQLPSPISAPTSVHTPD